MYIYVYMRADGKKGWSFVLSLYFLRLLLLLFVSLVVLSVSTGCFGSRAFAPRVSSKIFREHHPCLFFESRDCENRPNGSTLPIHWLTPSFPFQLFLFLSVIVTSTQRDAVVWVLAFG